MMYAVASCGNLVIGAVDSASVETLREMPVEVWDVAARRRLSAFMSVWTYGGARLAIGAERVFAAAWARKGVAAYALDGTVLWRRQDIKHTQQLWLTSDETRLFVVRDRAGLLILDAATGSTVQAVRRAWEAVAAPPDGSVVVCSSRQSLCLDPGHPRRLAGPTPQDIRGDADLRAAAFGPGRALVSVSSGRAHVYALPSWEHLRSLTAPDDGLWTDLAWVPSRQEFVLFRIPGALDRLDAAGTTLRPGPLLVDEDRRTFGTFCTGGRVFVAWDGKVYDTETSAHVDTLPWDAAGPTAAMA